MTKTTGDRGRSATPPATPGNEPAGHPKREGNEIAGSDQAQPPSGLRPDLERPGKDRRGGDGGGVDKSL